MDIREYIRLGKLNIYIKTLIWRYKLDNMRSTLKLMENKLKEVRKWD